MSSSLPQLPLPVTSLNSERYHFLRHLHCGVVQPLSFLNTVPFRFILDIETFKNVIEFLPSPSYHVDTSASPCFRFLSLLPITTRSPESRRHPFNSVACETLSHLPHEQISISLMPYRSFQNQYKTYPIPHRFAQRPNRTDLPP